MLATLSGRVRELQSRVAQLEGDLEGAHRRLATYEQFDDTIQAALNEALRAAHEIRGRAEESAAQVLEGAREERRLILKEIERLRDERDALQNELAEMRRGGLALARPRAAEPAAADLRAVASEAIRSIFEEVLQDVRRRVVDTAAPPEPAPRPAPAPAVQAQPYVPPTATPPAAAPPAAPPAYTPPTYTPPAYTPPSYAPPAPPTPPTYTPQAPPRQPAPPPAAPAYEPPRAPAAERAEPAAPVYEPPRAPERPPLAEAPRPVAPPVSSADRPIVSPGAPERIAQEPAAPSTELQLVLSPVASFPRLVEIERRIQALPSVRTLYVRDFRNGVATLAVGLRAAMTAADFAQALGMLEAPKFHVQDVRRNLVELRIDGEAATA